MVFCATREAVRHLQGSLMERGFNVVALSGELSQSDRTQALQSMRDGRARVCVATDVAARGIDLPDLGLVIHADLPNDRETLLHRSGRTGRAGRKGVCVLLVPYTKRRRAEQMIQAAGIDVGWSGPPTADEIRALDQERLVADPILTEDFSEEDIVVGRLLLANSTAETVAAALVRLYRARLPAPEDMLDSGPQRDMRGGARDMRTARDGRDGTAARGGEPRAFPRGEPGASAQPPSSGDMVWFRMNVGRQKNADPRWLLPLICRLGHVTKKDIGAIRIFDRDTRFEIAREAAAKFAIAIRRTDDEEVHIEQVAAGEPGAPVGERKYKRDKPARPQAPRRGA